MRTVAIIQASMGSQRLPGKTMADVCGKPMLARVVERAQRARLVDEIIVATTDGLIDAPIADWCVANNVPCYCCGVYLRPGKGDLLATYYEAALWRQADVIVRITADCPLVDAAIIDAVVGARDATGVAYCSNVYPPTYPDGLDVEAVAFSTLEKAHHDAVLPSDREHVTPFIRRHCIDWPPGVVNIQCYPALFALRWTVDEAADLEFVRAVYAELGEVPFGMAEVLELLARRPELRQINAGIQRNEGYAKSVQGDTA